MSYTDDRCASPYCNTGWGELLSHMSPYGYANFGIAFGLGFSVVGAAWGIWLTGSSLVGAAVKSPRIRSKNLIRNRLSVILMLHLDPASNQQFLHVREGSFVSFNNT
eukprot:scaffold10203_cov272-Chaetoceros_neogracile.AAC.33